VKANEVDRNRKPRMVASADSPAERHGGVFGRQVVTYDQIYLAEQLALKAATNYKDEVEPISPAAIQRLNNEFGTTRVLGAMRMLHGFPPRKGLKDVYAYIWTMLREESA
jgi:hypothetical protein